MTTNPCCALPEELRNESGGLFGFVAIGRPEQDEDCCRHGVTVEEFLSKPENFGGTWLIDGGWGGPPGPIRVDWLNSQSRWQSRGYSAECGDPFLPSPSTTTSQATMNQEWITDRPPTEADGDMDGDVRIRRAPGSDRSRLTYWSYVQPGMDWQHSSFWQPPAEPAPAEPDRIDALEQRVAELEAFKRTLMQSSPTRKSLGL